MTVSAAASLTNAFAELKTAFEKSHQGLTVHTNFAASNPLLKQMQEVVAKPTQTEINTANIDYLLMAGGEA